jgi:hypothetical protein
MRSAIAEPGFRVPPISARRSRSKILGDAEGNTAFDDMLLPGHPLHMFAKAAAPLVEGWYRLRDVGNF